MAKGTHSDCAQARKVQKVQVVPSVKFARASAMERDNAPAKAEGSSWRRSKEEVKVRAVSMAKARAAGRVNILQARVLEEESRQLMVSGIAKAIGQDGTWAAGKH